MCLSNIKGPFIAEEDIKCQKVLTQTYNSLKFPIDELMINSNVATFLQKLKVLKQKEKLHKIEGTYYLLQNDFKGATPSILIKTEYKFSWVLDSNVTDVYINNISINSKITLATYYQRFEVKPGMLCESEIEINMFNNIKKVLHSFVDDRYYNYIIGFCKERVMVECVIPKGATYYIGKFYNNNDSYASNQLQYPDSFF